MFSSLGLFKGIPCPRQHECSLPNCFFLHDQAASLPTAVTYNKAAQEYDPFSAGEIEAPAPKRRRLASPRQTNKDKDTVSLRLDSEPPTPQPAANPRPMTTSPRAKDGISASPARVLEAQSTNKALPASIARTVSPPPTRDSKPSVPSSAKKVIKAESLTPRNVAKAPAVWKTRLAVLQKLHEQLQAQNQKLAAAGDKWKPLVLDKQELITFALDEEETASNLGESIYKNAMAQRVLRIKKMTIEEWVKAVADWTGTSSRAQARNKSEGDNRKLLPAGLSSTREQIAVLRHLRTPLEGLERFGYVTSKPTAGEMACTKAALATSAGFESCDRCGTRFQVFPGRDESGRLTSKGKCRYHWARVNRSTSFKTERIMGQSEAIYPCCNKAQGSEGCSEAETHVFSVKDPKRLATILQFEHTPEKPDIRGSQPISFDCEMGYTTLGMEVIRVTAVSWPEGRLLLDVLVRPYGEILDLNTRFSGVTQQAFANAPPYDFTTTDEVESVAADTSEQTQELRKVDSPAVARQLLFDRLSPNTPLIGHAIENDLNVCRIIHPFVIDTALLYPHPRGMPIRFSLKVLSQKHLSRGIQTGGEAGHDSKEDAIATGDLVTKKVAEKWSIMHHEGWEFVDGMLMAPEETKRVETVRQSML